MEIVVFYLLMGGVVVATFHDGRNVHPVSLILSALGVMLLWPLVLLEWWSQGE